ncbi:hypothetical protein Daudx_2025 [Candidatus Desulforudis audaxviator]|nr:hypothetical protein Daudx_2025 [Candidatus Desulforudis audaxviator]
MHSVWTKKALAITVRNSKLIQRYIPQFAWGTLSGYPKNGRNIAVNICQ